MTNFRHLTWMLIAAFGLVFSATQSHAQKRPDHDEPGLIADDGYELEPEWKKQVVYFRTNEAPGTIIVVTAERHLYLVQGNGRAIRYGIGVGRDGFQWQGLVNITRKAEWPDWTPPPEMIQRQPYLPRFMAGGPGNPLIAPPRSLDPERDPAFYRLDFRVEKKWQLGASRWLALVAEMMNATLHKETVQGQEIGPVSIPSLGLEGGL